MTAPPFGGHDGGIRVGGTDHEVGHAPIGSPNDPPVRFSHLLNPVVTLLVCPGQVLPDAIFQGDGEWDGSHDRGFTGSSGGCLHLVRWCHLVTDRLWTRCSILAGGWAQLHISRWLWSFFPFRGEEFSQMFFDCKAWLDRVHRGVRIDFGSVNIELFSPDQSCLLALIDNGLKETTKDLHPIARTDTGEAGMVGKRLAKVIP